MSEQTFEQMLNESFKTIHTGEVVEGTVIDVKPDEIILNIGYKSDGVLTKSEYSNDNSIDLTTAVKVGDTIDAKIIAIDKERLSLSMKQLVEDPWLSEVENLKKGAKVEGTVTRITPFGAFVQISPAVEALVHVSELGEGSYVDPEKVFTLNERKTFKVLDIDKEGRKISLSIAK